MADKPRILQNNRDMILSLIPLVLVCVVIAAIASQCSFRPGGPSQGPVPKFDVAAALRSDAAGLTFPIRLPQVPAGWQPNSGTRGDVVGREGGKFSTVGFITNDGRYMQLTQTDAGEATLVPFIAGADRYATGAEQIDGHNWVVYGEEGVEPIWVSDLGNVRLLLRGAGTNANFVELAKATTAAPPLPR